MGSRIEDKLRWCLVLAFVPIELFLQIGLGVLDSRECPVAL
jgi:hypothetical protein